MPPKQPKQKNKKRICSKKTLKYIFPSANANLFQNEKLTSQNTVILETSMQLNIITLVYLSSFKT